jgi:hypothetical protein
MCSQRIKYKFILIFVFLVSGCSSKDNSILTPQKEFKEYAALISQSGINPPSDNVIFITLGIPVSWIRTGVGSYECIAPGAFTLHKTFWIIQSPAVSDQSIWISQSNEDEIYVCTFDKGNLSDNILSKTSINIKVYRSDL